MAGDSVEKTLEEIRELLKETRDMQRAAEARVKRLVSLGYALAAIAVGLTGFTLARLALLTHR